MEFKVLSLFSESFAVMPYVHSVLGLFECHVKLKLRTSGKEQLTSLGEKRDKEGGTLDSLGGRIRILNSTLFVFCHSLFDVFLVHL